MQGGSRSSRLPCQEPWLCTCSCAVPALKAAYNRHGCLYQCMFGSDRNCKIKLGCPLQAVLDRLSRWSLPDHLPWSNRCARPTAGVLQVRSPRRSSNPCSAMPFGSWYMAMTHLRLTDVMVLFHADSCAQAVDSSIIVENMSNRVSARTG